MGNPDLVLFEPDFRGHRAVFLGYLLRYANEQGIKTRVAVSDDAIASREFVMNDILALVGPADAVYRLGPLPRSRDSTYRRWLGEKLQEIYDRFPHERVTILEGEPFVRASGRIERRHLARTTVLAIRRPILFGTTVRSTINSWGKQVGLSLLKIRGARVVVLGASEPRHTGPRKQRQIAPDPVEYSGTDRAAAEYREKVALAEGRTWFGVFGNIVRRKNLDQIAEALSLTENPTATGLLVAGRMDDAELERCRPALEAYERKGGRYILDNRLLPTEELDAAIGAVDVAVFAQAGDSPSNIYGKACAAGTPVVCSGSVILRSTIRRDQTGLWTRLKVDKMARAYSEVPGMRANHPQVMAGPNDFAEALLEIM